MTTRFLVCLAIFGLCSAYGSFDSAVEDAVLDWKDVNSYPKGLCRRLIRGALKMLAGMRTQIAEYNKAMAAHRSCVKKYKGYEHTCVGHIDAAKEHYSWINKYYAHYLDYKDKLLKWCKKSIPAPPVKPMPPTGCACPKIYRPVCGKDGNTYSNSCEARCRGVAASCNGKCPCQKACACPKIYSPVCGKNGKTYSNACVAKCGGAAVACKGKCPCPKACACPLIYAPVCGANGKTFSNSCAAKCANTAVKCKGKCPCKKACACPKIYAPVCGKNGKTYSNACVARCGGTAVACKGRCPCQKACACPLIYAPVCGANGKTYSNACGAKCASAAVKCKGKCPCKKACACPLIHAPVCGKDGKTYGNSCAAKCGDVAVACKGECPCPKACACPLVYAPVCGANGKTYSNACAAKCANTAVKCKGKCPCPKVCACPKIYAPVCGSNGKTYSNSCTAKCAGAAVSCTGNCPCKPKGGAGCLDGTWEAVYTCRGKHIETFSVKSSGNHVVITKIKGDRCINGGQVSFQGQFSGPSNRPGGSIRGPLALGHSGTAVRFVTRTLRVVNCNKMTGFATFTRIGSAENTAERKRYPKTGGRRKMALVDALTDGEADVSSLVQVLAELE